MTRLLIAIESCHRDRDKHQAQHETWLKDLFIVEHKFFIGWPLAQSLEEDEVQLTVDDGYGDLSVKTQSICRWALAHDYDCVFKCDVDTLVNPYRFLFSGFQRHDYFGGENADVNVSGFEPERIEFCSGGAGYWLSKKALTIIAEAGSIKTAAEDVFVAHALKEAGIRPVFHQGYRWHPGAAMDKDTVTLHLSSALQKKYVPEMMYEYYQKIVNIQYDQYTGSAR
jgi:hypothetical protein